MSLRRTKLATMSAKRRAELAAEGNPFPTSTFASKPKMAAAKRPKDTGPDAATVAAAMERDGGRCVGCGDPVHGQPYTHVWLTPTVEREDACAAMRPAT